MTWIEQLRQARATVAALRQSIRGNSPSQLAMSEKLLATIVILDTQIAVEKQLI